ncbi:aminopeptidase P family N-terminal domain-containing protein [Spiroplasma clarkii]|uniref:aminopeptidase P family N-terminal domain-containing protein n=1 Tax=Spiroplasma clarkii TaxID=2139 RepID=UPI001C9928E6|nr:aminopeptidase P family N-terminal domain-containing protein [Spiroplasma clarkii]
MTIIYLEIERKNNYEKTILNEILQETKADAILLYSPQNRYWFTRFSSSLGYVLYTKDKTFYLSMVVT